MFSAARTVTHRARWSGHYATPAKSAPVRRYFAKIFRICVRDRERFAIISWGKKIIRNWKPLNSQNRRLRESSENRWARLSLDFLFFKCRQRKFFLSRFTAIVKWYIFYYLFVPTTTINSTKLTVSNQITFEWH